MIDVINDPSILEEVLDEAFELRQDLEQCLLALETNPEDLDSVHRAFRCVHSIKGNCGMLGLDAISEFTHEMESVLDRLRKEEIEFTRTTCDLLLAGADVLEGLLASTRDKQPVPAERDQVLIRLREFLAGVAAKPSISTEPVQRIEDKVAQDLEDLNAECLKECLDESFENLELMEQELCVLDNDSANQQSLGNVFRTVHTIAGMSGCFNLGKLRKVASAGESLLDQMRDGLRRVDRESLGALRTLVEGLRDILTCVQKTGSEGAVNFDHLCERLQALEKPVATSPQPENLRIEQSPPASLVSESVAVRPVENNIRVNVQLLDKLMNLVRELVLTRNQFSTLAGSLSDPTFLRTAQRLNLSTAELQEVVMKIRMQPIGNIWNSFSRLVRDLTLSLGKQVRIEMEGIDTELDRTIIEAVRDPLTHLVRNALDHGFETPEERRRCGKPAEGRLFLRAYHDGGYVNIEISDDGAGLNVERVRNKALERGLISTEQAASLSERDAVQLILLPGFSTAEQITDVSGRGVGMDVVKTNIERIGGTIDLQSRPGQGTTVRMKIPLTLAIIPALIVTNGGDRYAIPQVNLVELLRLEGDQIEQGIESIHGAAVYRLRGKLLPLVNLSECLGLGQNGTSDQLASDRVVNLIVLRANDRQFGLVVDKVNDTEEIVVKPLGRQLKSLSQFAGATIMGDGTVALILDVMGLAVASGLDAEIREHRSAGHEVEDGQAEQVKQSLLIVDLGDSRRFALPTSLVSRLEKVPRSSIEHSDGREVIQYRGDILPLVRLDDIFGAAVQDDVPSEELQIVVYAEQGHSCGLVVRHIVDVIDTALNLQSPKGANDELLGTTVIQQRVTDVLNLKNVARFESRPGSRTPLATLRAL